MPGDDARRSSASRPAGAVGGWLLPPDFYREREVTVRDWVEAIFEPAALVALVGLFVGGITRFLQVFAPEWDSRLIGPLALVVSLEAFLYGRRLARSSILLKEWAVLLVPPILVLKLFPYVVGTGDLVSDLGIWWRSPSSVLSFDFIVGTCLLLLAWQMTLGATLDLGYIRVQRGEVPVPGDPGRLTRYDADDSSWRRFDHSAPLRLLSSRVLWGGVLLALLGAIVALDSAQLLTPEALLELVSFRRPGPSAALANVVTYYAVGLLFLAEAAYVRRRTAWQVERLEPPPTVGTAWIAQAAVGVVAIVLIAIVLPTSYSLTISQLLDVLLGAVVSVAQFIVALIMVVFLAILYPFSLLFPGGGGDSSAQPAMPPPAAAPPAASVPLLEVLQSLVFWLVALGVVVYALSVIWRKRPPLPGWLGRGVVGRFLRGIGRLLASIWRAGEKSARRVIAALPRLRPRQPLDVARPFRWLSLRTLGPRELVEYFYLSVIERATRLGFGRESGETAAEFSRRLPARFPDSEPELHELTDAFLQARYGPRPVDEGLVKSARARWQALKLKLRARRLARREQRDPRK